MHASRNSRLSVMFLIAMSTTALAGPPDLILHHGKIVTDTPGRELMVSRLRRPQASVPV